MRIFAFFLVWLPFALAAIFSLRAGVRAAMADRTAHEEMSVYHFELRQNRSGVLIGILCMILGGTMLLFLLDYADMSAANANAFGPLTAFYVCLALFLAGALVVVCILRPKVRFDNHTIYIRPLLGGTRSVEAAEVSCAKTAHYKSDWREDAVWVYAGKKKLFKAHANWVGYPQLLLWMQQWEVPVQSK